MGTIDEVGWMLGNAEAFHKSHPSEFQIPELSEREALRPGDKVKLVFLFWQNDKGEPYVLSERMWVVIQRVVDSKYVGVLQSDPVSAGRVKVGDLIEFGPEHVASVFFRKNDPRHPEYWDKS